MKKCINPTFQRIQKDLKSKKLKKGLFQYNRYVEKKEKKDK